MHRFASFDRPLRAIRRAMQACAVASFTLMLAPGTAVAHGELVTADPLPNAAVVEAPAELRMTFSEPIDPANAFVDLLDSQLRRVAGVGRVALSDDGRLAVVGLPALEPGTYTVSYQVVSTVDGHATSGIFAFAVDPTGAEAPPTIAPVSSSPSVDPVAIAARWVALAAALVALGTLIMWWRAAAPVLGALGPGTSRSPPWRVVAAAALTAFTGLSLYVWLASRPIAHGGHDGLPFDLAAPYGFTPFAIAMRVALAGTLLAGVAAVAFAILDRGRDGRPYRSVVATGAFLAAALAGMSAAGHASSLGGPLGAAVDWLHLVAAAAWLGGLLAVYPLARRGAAAGVPARAVGRDILRRHGSVAIVAAPVVVLTGLANSPAVAGATRELVASQHGNLLLAKAALASVALGIGAVNHRLLRRPRRGSVAVLVGAELVVAAMAVMAAAAMVTLQPGAARQPAVIGPPVNPAHFFGEVGPSSVHASVSVPAPGNQAYLVTVSDAATGAPRPDVQKVFVTFTPPRDSGLPAERVELEPRDTPGLYGVGGAYTPVVGEWGFEVTVRRSGARDETLGYRLPVSAPSPPVIATPPDGGVGVPAPVALLWAILPHGAAAWLPAAVAVLAVVGLGWAGRRAAGAWIGPARALLAAAAVVALIGVGSRAVVEAANQPPGEALAEYAVDMAAASAARGEPVYRANCAGCHALDGRGDGPVQTLPGADDLAETVPAMSDAELSYRIANGLAGTPMPAFAAILTEQERDDLVAYLRDRWDGR